MVKFNLWQRRGVGTKKQRTHPSPFTRVQNGMSRVRNVCPGFGCWTNQRVSTVWLWPHGHCYIITVLFWTPVGQVQALEAVQHYIKTMSVFSKCNDGSLCTYAEHMLVCDCVCVCLCLSKSFMTQGIDFPFWRQMWLEKFVSFTGLS